MTQKSHGSPVACTVICGPPTSQLGAVGGASVWWGREGGGCVSVSQGSLDCGARTSCLPCHVITHPSISSIIIIDCFYNNNYYNNSY